MYAIEKRKKVVSIMSNSVLEALYFHEKRFHDVIVRVRIGEARAGADEHAGRQKFRFLHNPTESSLMWLQSCKLPLAFQKQATYW